MLVIHDLVHSYSTRSALSGVSADINQGSVLGLYGENGSGKSTLLKILGGVLPKQKGDVYYCGESIFARDGFLRRDLRKFIGILFQTTSSDEKLSVRDNLQFAAQLYGIAGGEQNEVIDQALSLAQLRDRADDPVKTLSGGMKRRLELYRTFMHRPTLLLLDEPTAGLDHEHRMSFLKFLEQYRSQTGAIIVLCSHVSDDLMNADRVVMLKDGTVLANQSPCSFMDTINYVRCELVVSDQFDLTSLEQSSAFELRFDRSCATVHAKILKQHVSKLFSTSLIENKFVHRFTVEKAQLADAYGVLTQNHKAEQCPIQS